MGAKKGERGEATLGKRAGLSDDDLKWVLDRTGAYIRDADAKNGMVIAALAVLLPLPSPMESSFQRQSRWSSMAAGISLSSCFAAFPLCS